ncbi:MAG: MASE1 domain-containing protein [Deltaproteobacteria bacterium]|nr:MASE1 domain-containing protein [Deltaproteobacteria bacterium]
MDHGRTHSQRAVELGILAVVYVVAARLGLQLDAASGFATLVWPPTGIAIAALLLRGMAIAPGVWLGAFIANAWTGAPVVAAAGIATGNTVEAVVALLLLRRLAFDPGLRRVRDVVGLAGVALASTTLSATIGVLCLMGAGVVDVTAAGDTWRAWWLGDALGALVVTPLLLTWATPAPRPVNHAETAGLLVAVVVASALAFSGVGGSQPYLLFPVLLLAAVRLGPRGASASAFLASAVAVTATTLGWGPFVPTHEPTQLRASLTALQLFMGFTAVTFLVTGALAAVAAQQRQELSEALVAMGAARAEAEKASTLKSNLLSVVSHELRTPLAALILQLERMKVTDDDADRDRLLGRMFAQSRRLQTLIESLLQQARIQSGRLPATLERTDVAALVLLVCEEARPQAESQGLVLVCDVSEPLEASTDPHLLRLIVSNLVGNAIKFTPAGSVSVSVRRAAPDQGGGCRIDVEDTGPGIPSSEQARIFEPFEQLGDTRNKHLVGIGLGLTLVRELTRSLGGTVSVVSDVAAGGCCFSVFLPLSAGTGPGQDSPHV